MKKIIYLAVLLTGCSVHNSQISTPLNDMQSLALCQSTDKAISQKEKIMAEYGFKRFAKNTYKPLLEQRLFGHEIRVITLEPRENKLYVAGNPLEFRHHFSSILNNIVCAENTCEASIDDYRTLYITRPVTKKSKDTTVIKCVELAQDNPG